MARIIPTAPSAAPTPPIQRGDRTTFAPRVDAAITYLTGAPSEIYGLALTTYTNAVDAYDSATAADSSRVLAQAAAQAAVATPSAAGTSTTSLALGFGSKSLTLAQLDRTFKVGQTVSIASTADARDWMAGTITAFTMGTGAMTVNVLNVGTASAGVFPTLANWTVALTGPGAQTSQVRAESFVPVAMPALDMDLTLGDFFTKTISGNSAFTFSNFPTGKSWTMELTITSGMVSFPSSLRWVADSPPALATGKTHLITFVTSNGGARVRAAVLPGYTT